MNDKIRLNMVDAPTLAGTAQKSNFGNISFRSSSVEQEPSTRLPPEENGEIAELWAPITIQVNNTRGLIPEASAREGTRGYSAGQTTPKVLEKKLIIAPITLKAIGTNHDGRLLPAHAASKSRVPALIATLISIPTPQIIIIVFQGTFAMTSF